MTGTGGGPARLIRVYGAWILLVTAAVVGAAAWVGTTAPREFRAEAVVVVEARVRANTTPLAPDMGTEKELAQSGLVVDPTARSLSISPEELLAGLDVQVATDANVLTLSYTDISPQTAQQRAEAMALAYIAYRNAGEADEPVPVAGKPAPVGAATTSTRHATLVTHAAVPAVPVRNPIWVTIGAGLAIGLILGIGTALIRDRRNDRIRGRDDFQQISGSTVLATVPRARRGRGPGAQRPVILRAPQSPAAESFRYLRARLQPLLPPTATILVASAGDREGRTTIAANLAVAMAQSDRNVILVNADLRDPRLHMMFGVREAVGLTSVLAGECTAAEALQGSPVPRLRILAAGPLADNSSDLLESDRLRHLLKALHADCDVVVLDSAPVLSVSDTITLAAVADRVLLVGDYRRTTRGFVTRTLAELSDVVRGNVSAVLLNAPRSAGGLKPDRRHKSRDATPIETARADPGTPGDRKRPTNGDEQPAVGSASIPSPVSR